MNIRIQLDTPTGESLRYLLEEMVTDPFVGMLNPKGDKSAWVNKQIEKLNGRLDNDIPATVAYHSSGIVAIAFSHPLNLSGQSKYANLHEDNQYWKMGNFYVLKKFRGLGIGTRMLDYFLKEKEGNVIYFADILNQASNSTARKCGMYHLHDFFKFTYSDRFIPLKKGKALKIKSIGNRFHVYSGNIPARKLLLDPHLSEPTKHEKD